MPIKTKKAMEVRVMGKTELVDNDVETIFEKKVTSFGTGAKINCSKEHLGKDAYVIIKKRKNG